MITLFIQCDHYFYLTCFISIIIPNPLHLLEDNYFHQHISILILMSLFNNDRQVYQYQKMNNFYHVY